MFVTTLSRHQTPELKLRYRGLHTMVTNRSLCEQQQTENQQDLDVPYSYILFLFFPEQGYVTNVVARSTMSQTASGALDKCRSTNRSFNELPQNGAQALE
ncbi:hypothetical protein PoB_000638500 [Plakobranchus ocellatus]|uniref:Uncharacterized protein n=1 Tax=Plakobranchus ocellatus TaxID=259542 RepID=A0AAV3Y9W1_9GAST|nr:hypothetical protein PoB_000638500 [Plakobranchus ocellatus]